MRLDRLFWVLALTARAATGECCADPQVVLEARHLFETGVAQERLGQNRQAIDTLTEAINSHALTREDSARAVLDRGIAFDALGNVQAAIADYSAALHKQACLSVALNNRGNAYRRTDRLDLATRDYLAALKCAGAAQQYPYYGLGMIAARNGDNGLARDYFRKALAADPSFVLAQQSLSALGRVTLQPALPARMPPRPTQPARTPPLVQAAGTPPPTAPARAPVRAMPGLMAVAAHQIEPQLRLAIREAAPRPARAKAMIQLGAFRDQQSAEAAWARIAAQSGGALDGMTPTVVTADLPGRGRFWRLRAVAADVAAAKNLCSSLSARGQACMAVRD